MRVVGLRDEEEPLHLAGLPRVDEMRVAAGALVAEVARHDAFAFGDELHLIFGGHFAAIDRGPAPASQTQKMIRRSVGELTCMPK